MKVTNAAGIVMDDVEVLVNLTQRRLCSVQISNPAETLSWTSSVVALLEAILLFAT
jgi:hypothetical protein